LRKIAIVGGMIALPTPEARDAQADFSCQQCLKRVTTKIAVQLSNPGELDL
jgi:hypothetical protein